MTSREFLTARGSFNMKQDRIYIADLHCDSVLQIRRGYDLAQRHADYHIDIPRLREGGVGLQVFACGLNPFVRDKDPFGTINAQLDVLHQAIEKHSDSLGLCCDLASAQDLIAQDRIACFLALEGGEPLEGAPGRIKHFYKRGMRLITLAHERPTGWCTSWNKPGEKSEALTDLGREIIAEMNRLGVLIDLSHASRNTFWEIAKISRQPIIASHSCADRLVPTERNLTDEQIRAIADSGGVIGVTFIHFLLSATFLEHFDSFWEKYPTEGKELRDLYLSTIPEQEKMDRWNLHRDLVAEQDRALADVLPTLEDVADHIDYIANLAGIDHVAIGSDFDGVIPLPRGLEDCSKLPNLISELRNRNYTESDLEKICSKNFLRVLGEICG
jgi:membrane dipeptidase